MRRGDAVPAVPVKKATHPAKEKQSPKVEEVKVEESQSKVESKTEKPPKKARKSKVEKEPELQEEIRDDGKIQWRKHGAGSFRMADGRIIKKGQTFWAREDEVPQGFRDNIKPLAPLLKKEGPKVVSSTEFEITERRVRDLQGLASSPVKVMYDVINKASRKAMNEDPLTKEAAADLMKALA